MEELKTNSEALKKKFDSPEWKAEVDKMRKDALESTKEYREATRKEYLKQ